MPLQDLTPQLRTRLRRVERAVGWFVLLAALLLITGFVYYVWHTAQRKGWFVEKVPFSTCLNTATGIKPGDQIKLMGFPIGEVTKVVPNDPYAYYNITVFFNVRHDTNGYCGYIWSDSKVRIAAGDFLGNRTLEIIKGQTGVPALRIERPDLRRAGRITGQLDRQYLKRLGTNVAKVLTEEKESADPADREIRKVIQALGQQKTKPGARTYATSLEDEVADIIQHLFNSNPVPFYLPYINNAAFFIEPDESPALTERIERVVDQAERALPNILNLTNQVAQVLSNAVRLTASLDTAIADTHPAVTNANVLLTNLDHLVVNLRPVVTNLTVITAQLREPKGSFGEWLIPTNLNLDLQRTLQTAQDAMNHTDTNLTAIVANLNRSLDNLADITSNLNRQVQANTNILADISDLVRNTDTLVQGLRRHWFLRSAFKTKPTNAPPTKIEKKRAPSW